MLAVNSEVANMSDNANINMVLTAKRAAIGNDNNVREDEDDILPDIAAHSAEEVRATLEQKLTEAKEQGLSDWAVHGARPTG